jgi:hypothetical protein
MVKKLDDTTTVKGRAASSTVVVAPSIFHSLRTRLALLVQRFPGSNPVPETFLSSGFP